MIRKFLLGLVLLFAFSCDRDKDEDSIKQENGNIWLSGGLYNCAEQIHLDNNDTLIVKIEDIKALKSGDRVKVKYKEIGVNEFCPSGIDCEIIEIRKVD